MPSQDISFNPFLSPGFYRDWWTRSPRSPYLNELQQLQQQENVELPWFYYSDIAPSRKGKRKANSPAENPPISRRRVEPSRKRKAKSPAENPPISRRRVEPNRKRKAKSPLFTFRGVPRKKYK